MQTYPTQSAHLDIVRIFMARTYSWMAAGLALTAGVAWITAQNPVLSTQVMGLTVPLFIAQLLVVIILSAGAHAMPSAAAGALFIGYAALTGLSFSSVLLAYDQNAVTAAFATTAGTFGLMSAAGFMLKKDLSGVGRFLMFAVLGLLVAMVVNLFLGSSVLTLVISVVGVLLFAGLTVHDTQMLRNLALSGVQGEQAERAAINGALSLYLNFINMFLFILRLFGIGSSRD